MQATNHPPPPSNRWQEEVSLSTQGLAPSSPPAGSPSCLPRPSPTIPPSLCTAGSFRSWSSPSITTPPPSLLPYLPPPLLPLLVSWHPPRVVSLLCQTPTFTCSKKLPLFFPKLQHSPTLLQRKGKVL